MPPPRAHMTHAGHTTRSRPATPLPAILDPAAGFALEPIIDRGSPGRFAHLFGWADLADLVAERPDLGVWRDPARDAHSKVACVNRYGIVSVSEDGIPEPRRHWAHDERGPVDVVALNHRLRSGATLVVRRVDEFVPAVGSLVRDIEDAIRAPASALAVASFRDRNGFDRHLDVEDTIILQIAGRKHWQIHAPTRSHPLPTHQDDRAPLPDGPPDLDLDLGDGDALHVPRGWWHRVDPVGVPSLHLLINTYRRTAVDFFDWLCVDQLAPALRGATIGADREEHEALFADIERALVDAADVEALDRYLDGADLQHSRLRPRICLPTASLRPDGES